MMHRAVNISVLYATQVITSPDGLFRHHVRVSLDDKVTITADLMLTFT